MSKRIQLAQANPTRKAAQFPPQLGGIKDYYQPGRHLSYFFWRVSTHETYIQNTVFSYFTLVYHLEICFIYVVMQLELALHLAVSSVNHKVGLIYASKKLHLCQCSLLHLMWAGNIGTSCFGMSAVSQTNWKQKTALVYQLGLSETNSHWKDGWCTQPYTDFWVPTLEYFSPGFQESATETAPTDSC